MSDLTVDEIVQRAHEIECLRRGHTWSVIEEVAIGPVRVICGHCGADSGLARPSARDALRDVAIAFLRRPPTTRWYIAEQLGLADGLDEFDAREQPREILRRVREAGKVDQLRAALLTERS